VPLSNTEREKEILRERYQERDTKSEERGGMRGKKEEHERAGTS
jgi:hypothetical protein